MKVFYLLLLLSYCFTWNIVLKTNRTLNLNESFNYAFSNSSSLLGVRWTLNSTKNFEVILYNSTQTPFINPQFQYFRIPKTNFSFQEFFNTTKQLSIFIRNLENNEPQIVFITLEELYHIDNLPLILGLSIGLPLLFCCFYCCCQTFVWTSCILLCWCGCIINEKKQHDLYLLSLNNNKKDESYDVKLVFMGSGDAGKSTFFKHVRYMVDPWTLKKEEHIHLNTVYSNIIDTIASLYSYIQKEGIDISNEDQEIQSTLQKCYDMSSGNIMINGTNLYTKELHNSIVKLVKRSFFITTLPKCRIPYHIFEGAEYFISNIDKIEPPKYVPDVNDCLYVRRKTTGCWEYIYNHKIEGKGEMRIKLLDVGGQRNERKKWVHFYEEDRNIPVFMVALTEFDQLCYEDGVSNRLLESFSTFDDFGNNMYKDHDLVVVFTKKDLFKVKIKSEDIKDTFQDFQGESTDYDQVLDYIKQKFIKLNQNQNRTISFYEMNCLDQNDVKFVMEKLYDIISQSKFLKI